MKYTIIQFLFNRGQKFTKIGDEPKSQKVKKGIYICGFELRKLLFFEFFRLHVFIIGSVCIFKIKWSFTQ